MRYFGYLFYGLGIAALACPGLEVAGQLLSQGWQTFIGTLLLILGSRWLEKTD